MYYISINIHICIYTHTQNKCEPADLSRNDSADRISAPPKDKKNRVESARSRHVLLLQKKIEKSGL